MMLMESARNQGRLAEEMLAERVFLTGAALGPGGGPGARYQSPGLPCSSCVHDYGATCPEDWVPDELEMGAGACSANPAYDGPCPSSAFFNGMQRAEKEAFETRCLVCWPCRPHFQAPPPQDGPMNVARM